MATVVAATVACLLLVPAAAQARPIDPGDGQISAAQQAADAAAAQVGQITAQLAAAQARVAQAEATANIALGRFETEQADFQHAQAVAQQAQDVADQAQAARAEAQGEVAAFGRSSYIQGTTSPGFAAALTSDGPQQILERTALLAAANAHRTDVLAQMTAAEARANEAETAAGAALATATTLKSQAQADLTAATNLETQARQQAGSLQAEQATLQSQLQTAQQTLAALQGARAAALAYQQQAAAMSASGGSRAGMATTTSRGNPTLAQAAVNAALRYVGQMYAWGGGSTTGPSEGWGPDAGVVGFDCSGLTRYAYAQAGISLPRVAADQYTALPKVSTLQTGDLVFWATDPSDPSTIHHVAMYIGSGQVVEAPESGEQIKVVPMWYGYEYIGAARPTA